MSTPPPLSILRLKDVQARIQLSRSSIYSKMAAGDFPAPISLGRRAVGWLESEVTSWIRSRVVSSRKDWFKRTPTTTVQHRGGMTNASLREPT